MAVEPWQVAEFKGRIVIGLDLEIGVKARLKGDIVAR